MSIIEKIKSEYPLEQYIEKVTGLDIMKKIIYNISVVNFRWFEHPSLFFYLKYASGGGMLRQRRLFL